MLFAKMAEVARDRGRVLHLVVLLTVVCWLPYFSNVVLPLHDTAYVAESFHCFYRDMFHCGELARWFPYGNYGIQADLYQLAMHPTQYAVGSMGLWLGVDDTLLLMKIAMLLNEVLFALGLWLISRELYALALTRFLVSAGGVLSVSWFLQSQFNFCTFYLLPLVMYLVLRFFKTGHATFLFLAGIVELCSLLGNVAYIAPVHFWMLVVFAVPLACERPQSLKQLVMPRSLLNPWLWALLAVTAVIGLFMAGAAEHLKLLSPGRNEATGQVGLEVFLNHGRPPMAAALFGLTTGGIPHAPNTYYVGLLPLAMFVYALAHERQRAFTGIAAACAALTWLSIGGEFASLSTFLPGMKIYRHLALLYGIIGLLLLLAAGFGIERLFLRLAGRRVAQMPCRRIRWTTPIAVVILMLADFWFSKRPDDFTLPHLIAGWEPFFAFRILVYDAAIPVVYGLVRCRTGDPEKASMLPAIVLGLAFLLDVGSFRYQILQSLPTLEPGMAADSIFNAEKLPYRSMRSQIPADDRAGRALELLGRNLPDFRNYQCSMLYAFAGIDPCQPVLRTDFVSRGMYEMLVARGGLPKLHPKGEFLPAHDDAVPKIVGLRGAYPVPGESNADGRRMTPMLFGLFRELANPDTAVVLSPPAESSTEPNAEPVTVIRNREPLHSLGTIEVIDFSSNRLQVRTEVEHAQPVWLIYADAWHPGWTAKVDGRPTPVLRANVGFKAVQLTQGTHDVEFAFVDRQRTLLACGVALIGTLSGFGLCAVVVFALLQRSPCTQSTVIDTPIPFRTGHLFGRR